MQPPAKSAYVFLLFAILFAAGPVHAENATVQIVPGFRFEPAEVTIDAGESVTWFNSDGEVHSTTNGTGYDDPEWGTLWDFWFFNGPGESFVRTFETPGVYPYFCYPHLSLGMAGTVMVLAPSGVESSSWGEVKALFR
jgi:plastocyanin